MDNAASVVERATLGNVTRRLISFMFVLYIVAFVERVNVGFAALQMNEDLGFSEAVYGLGAGIFFIDYFLFELPSNLMLERIGAQAWIARIMITWAIVSMGMLLVQGTRQLLRPALFAGGCRGRVLPRYNPLPDLLVPRSGACPAGGLFHGLRSYCGRDRLLALGSTTDLWWTIRRRLSPR